MNEKKNSEEAENKLVELRLPYKKIKVSSIEEQEELNRLYSASLSPLDRLAYLLRLNINAYGRKSTKMNDFGTKVFPH